MSRLGVGQVAVILERVRTAGLNTEADSLSAHIDALAGEDRLIEHLQLVATHIAKSTASEDATRQMLMGFQPTIQASANALDRLVKVEERRMLVEEKQAEAEATVTTLRYVHIWGPIVGAVGGAITTAAAFYFALPS